MVQTSVITLVLKECKVFWAVVVSNAIDVMNHFARVKQTTDRVLNDQAVLVNVTVGVGAGMIRRTLEDIARNSHRFPACPAWISLTALMMSKNESALFLSRNKLFSTSTFAFSRRAVGCVRRFRSGFHQFSVSPICLVFFSACGVALIACHH